MKKILLILFLLVTTTLFSQGGFPVNSTVGSPKSTVLTKGVSAADSGYQYRTNFQDTGSANNGELKNVPGVVIRVRSDLWMRDEYALSWIKIGSNASVIDTTSLSDRINLKVNVRMFLDSLTAIRSAFPYFGTSTDPSASGSRFFDANGNDFYVVNVPTGSGIYSQTSPTLSAFRFIAHEGFGYPPSPSMDYFLTDKYSQIYSTVEYPDILSTFMIVTHAGSPSKSSFIKVSEDTSGSGSVVLSPYGGYLKISSLVSGLDTDSIMTYSSDGMVHKRSPSAFLSGINGVPDSRTLTINGTSYDLSANRSWTITTGDFYNTDGTFSGNRRGNLNGYRLTFDSGQVRYRDTLTSSTGKLYGGIYDYGKSGVEHINYDSLLTSYQSINTVTGVKFGVKDQNNLDTNNYIQVYASGIYSVTDSVPISDSSYKIATTKWVKDQLYGTGGGSGTVTSIGTGYGLSGGTITTTGTLLVDSASLSNYYLRIKDSLTSSNLLGYVTKTVLADSAAAIRTSIGSGGVADGYVDGATFSTSTNTLTLTQTGAADVTVRIPPSYLQNPIDQDSLIKEMNDSVGRIKAVKVVSDHPEILVTTTRNDSINTHTLSKIYISEPIATFSAGAGFVADTALFTDSTLYGSFFTDQDSFYITRVIVVMKGQAGDSLGIQIVHNDSINVTGTVIDGGTLAVNSLTTGNAFSVSTNQGIPPNSWVWLKSPTIIDGKKPEYLSVTLIGYKKYQAP